MKEQQDNKRGDEDKVIRFTLAGRRIKVRIEGDLELSGRSNAEIIDQLAKVPGRLAYWGAQKALIATKMDEAKVAEDQWFASKYFVTKEAIGSKGTETAIQNKIILDHGDEYLKLKTDIRELAETSSMVSAIVKAYEQQVWTLRAIVTLRNAELTSMVNSDSLSGIGGE
jgi:hypothetical protein